MTSTIEIPVKQEQDLINFCNKKIDHILVPQETGKADLIIHGDPNGTVCYNGNDLEFSELAPLIKSELNLKSNTITVIKVYCCYALCQKFYFGKDLWIIPACNNLRELYLKVSSNYMNYHCMFTYFD